MSSVRYTHVTPGAVAVDPVKFLSTFNIEDNSNFFFYSKFLPATSYCQNVNSVHRVAK